MTELGCSLTFGFPEKLPYTSSALSKDLRTAVHLYLLSSETSLQSFSSFQMLSCIFNVPSQVLLSKVFHLSTVRGKNKQTNTTISSHLLLPLTTPSTPKFLKGGF